jgi:transposase
MSNKIDDSGEALEIYRRKDVIEKGFDDTKNHVDMKRMRTHLTETTDGKMFCAFIALIAVSQIANGLSGIKRKKPIGKPEMIMELEKIKVVYLKDGRRLMNPVTKAQRTILEACGTTVDDLMYFIGNNGIH